MPIPEDLLRDGSAVAVMGACLLYAIKSLAPKKPTQVQIDPQSRTVCPVNQNGFRAALDKVGEEQVRQTQVLQEIARDIALLKDRTVRTMTNGGTTFE